MLYYALIFFIISVIAGFFGFRSVESGASKIAKLFFFFFLVLAAIVLISVVLGIKMFA